MPVTSSTPTISTIRLRNFRGIKGPLSVELPSPGKAGSALLIYGDNGSGKSSICDALEFATRGIVSRRLQGGEKVKREVRNRSAKDAPSVLLEMSDGASLVRGATRSPNWTWAETTTALGQSTMNGFENTPVVIRREAVESFWRIPEASRLDYFWDYLRPPGKPLRTAADDRAIQEHRRSEDALIAASASLLQVMPRNSWPSLFALPTHSNVAAAALHFGLMQSLQARGISRQPSGDELRRKREYLACLREEESLRHGAAQASGKASRSTDELRQLLAKIGPRVTSDFFAIYGEDWIEDIRFTIGPPDSLFVEIIRASGGPLRPEDVLSEAALDILSLVIAVELHLAASEIGQAKILVLDDVFQSVDSIFRKRIVDHLAARLTGWQLIVTFHDRLWLDICEREFTAREFRTLVVELRSQGFGGTPKLVGATAGPLRDLDNALETNASSVVVANLAGRALESLADHLSIMLSTQVRRKEGDRYTIGDLWPGVLKELSHSTDVGAKLLAQTMSDTQFLRNRAGAHASEWADGLSDREAMQSAQNVRDLWHRFVCQTCYRFGKYRRIGGGRWEIVINCCL